MLIKNYEERRDIVVRDAKIMLLNIINQTTDITNANWQNNGTKNSVKSSLNGFIAFVRDNKIVGWLGELDEFGYIQDFCNGKHDLDIDNLKDCLEAIRNSLFQ